MKKIVENISSGVFIVQYSTSKQFIGVITNNNNIEDQFKQHLKDNHTKLYNEICDFGRYLGEESFEIDEQPPKRYSDYRIIMNGYIFLLYKTKLM